MIILSSESKVVMEAKQRNTIFTKHDVCIASNVNNYKSI